MPASINQTENIVKTDDIKLSSVATTPLQVREAIELRKITDFTTFEVSGVVPYIDAEDANFYPVFYVSNTRCFLLEARLRHDTNSTSGTVDIEKLANGTARGSGVSMIESPFDISSGAGTTIRKKPSLTLANIQLDTGGAVALKAGGTLTGARHIVVTCLFGVNFKDIPQIANI